jgi:hypothetical protein
MLLYVFSTIDQRTGRSDTKREKTMETIFKQLLEIDPAHLDRLTVLVALAVVGMAVRAIIIMAKERR